MAKGAIKLTGSVGLGARHVRRAGNCKRATGGRAVKILARSAAKAAGLASASLFTNLVSVSARAAGMAKGSANLT
jgi:hypothetical protein